MDSVTQLVLGASVGHAVAGKTAGRKALVVGAIGGTIPDLDVLAYPLLDEVQRLGFHRAWSHSLLFVVLAAPVFGWLVHRLDKTTQTTQIRWMWVGFWSLLTHVLLDSFTVYGTGLFEPFSRYRVAFNSIFIIDPLYTAPIIAGVLTAWFAGRRNRSFAVRVNLVGLVLSTMYLSATMAAKVEANAAFESAMETQGITTTKMMTAPAPFNVLLWRALAETDEGFIEAYHSLWARDTPLFTPIASDPDALTDRLGSRGVAAVQWFSKGYYAVQQTGGKLIMSDLRFGRVGFRNEPFVFRFEILDTEHGRGSAIRMVRADIGDPADIIRMVWDRILGRT